MAYTKTIWASGDVISAEKLNNLENGVEAVAAKDVVTYTEFSAGADPALRKTIQLRNHDSISGFGSDGASAFNLIMLSKWNKCDIGSTGVTMNLNSKDGVVQLNDSKTLATTDQLTAETVTMGASDATTLAAKVQELVARIEALESKASA